MHGILVYYFEMHTLFQIRDILEEVKYRGMIQALVLNLGLHLSLPLFPHPKNEENTYSLFEVYVKYMYVNVY